jgi:hypothetical protein
MQLLLDYRLQIIGGPNKWQVEAVLEHLQNNENLSVCNGVSDFTVSQYLMWLSYGDSSENQQGERPPMEAVTRWLVREQTEKTQFV